MAKYIIRRITQAIPQLFIISLILFVLMQLIGDPLAVRGERKPPRQVDQARLRCEYGLDQPVLVQYLVWLVGNDWKLLTLNCEHLGGIPRRHTGVLRGDWGYSLRVNRPAWTVVIERIPNTLLLMLPAEMVILSLSLLIGIASALRQYSIFDHIVTTVSFVGYSMPVFWLALMLIYIFAIKFRHWGLPYLPTGNLCDAEPGCTLWEKLYHMVLPIATLTLISVAEYSRYIRSSLLEVLAENYVYFARAKGLHETTVVTRHALRNALLPFVTLVGLELPFLLAGAVVTETIYSWPGMGRLFVDHLAHADYPVLMGILMLVAVAVVILQILTDIAYAYLDPRIHLDKNELT